MTDMLHKIINRYLRTGEEVIERDLSLGGKIVMDGNEYFLLSEIGQRIGRGYSLQEMIDSCGENR